MSFEFNFYNKKLSFQSKWNWAFNHSENEFSISDETDFKIMDQFELNWVF